MCPPKVLVSILNWNKSRLTLECVASVLADCAQVDADVTVLVLDNGSQSDDVSVLDLAQKGAGFTLQKLPQNLGFTGGHNVSIRRAIADEYDFIWLLNNDATVMPGAFGKLIATMESVPECGAASPVVRASDDTEFIASCLSTHDWEKRISNRTSAMQEAQRIQNQQPEAVWLVGTAIFFRVEALRQVGVLDDRLFAYYDDNDIGARLSAAGWHSKCVFGASIAHDTRRSNAHHPLYFYYLMQRNEMLFWLENTPSKFRRRLWLKLIDTALFDVNRLYRAGLKAQGDAALLGVNDFIWRRFGKPHLDRKAPLALRLACMLSARLNEKRVLPPAIPTPG